MRKIDKIIVHCSATRPSQDIGAAEIGKWHKQQGWDEIGYHFVIRRNGQIENGRPVEKIGAHCKGHNADSIGICLVGGLDTEGKPKNNFTQNQFNSLRSLTAKLQGQFPDIQSIHGHNEFANKACPCFDVKKFFSSPSLRGTSPSHFYAYSSAVHFCKPRKLGVTETALPPFGGSFAMRKC